MKRQGQILVVIAILLGAVLMLLAVAVDGGRLLAERGRLRRAAQAACDAGLGYLAEQMVTLAVPRQTEAARRPGCIPDGAYGASGARCTATPELRAIASWLTDEDRQSLVSSPRQTQVASVALDYSARNGEPEAEIDFPHAFAPEGDRVRLVVRLQREVTILLAGLLGREFIDLEAQSMSELPIR